MGEPFTLASWNILQGLHHRSTRGRPVQNLPITDHLASLDADVLVLPETWRYGQPAAMWAEELAQNLGYELHQWIADLPSRTRENVPWRMVVLTRIPARRLPDQVLPQFATFGTRAVVRVELEACGLTIAGAHMFGIHLLMARRPRQWLRERAEFRKIAATHDIVAGDMNMWGPIVRRDCPGLRSAVLGRTYPSHRPHSQIDHILVNDRVDVISSDVLPNLGSDHRAVRATLRRSQ